MISYNTTFVMDRASEVAFVRYLRTIYVPAILEGQVLHSPTLRRILSHEEDEGSVSLALSFRAETEELLEGYLRDVGHRHSTALAEYFGERVLGFSTLMEHIEL